MKLRERLAWVVLVGSLIANLELAGLAWLRGSNTAALLQTLDERTTLLGLVHAQWQKTTEEAGTLRDRLRACQLYAIRNARRAVLTETADRR